MGIFFPRITFNCVSSPFLSNTLTTFQIWSKERTPRIINEIAKKIEIAIPSHGTTNLKLYSNLVYEFFNMQSGLWEEFKFEDTMEVFRWHISQGFPPELFQWRKIGGKHVGNLKLNRGSNFIQARINDDIDTMVYYGTIETRSHIF